MAVQPLLLDLTREYVSSLPAGAKVTINNEVIDYPIFRTIIDGVSVKKYVYIDEDVGHISKGALVDSLGRELDVKEFEVTKGEDGFMLVFIIDVTLEGAK